MVSTHRQYAHFHSLLESTDFNLVCLSILRLRTPIAIPGKIKFTCRQNLRTFMSRELNNSKRSISSGFFDGTFNSGYCLSSTGMRAHRHYYFIRIMSESTIDVTCPCAIITTYPYLRCFEKKKK